MLAAVAFAQVDRSRLNGQVLDESGASIPGAKVSIVNPETGFSRETETTSDGLFVFPAVPVGT